MSLSVAQENPLVIVHTTDLHPDGGVAFVHSVALAAHQNATLHTIHVNAGGSDDHRPMPDAQALLMRWMGEEGGVAHHKHQCRLCCDDLVETLLQEIRPFEPDLLVMGTHQHKGIFRLFRQSVSEAVALNLEVPTLFLPIGQLGFVDPQNGASHLTKIVVPVNHEEDSLSAIATLLWFVESAGLATSQAPVEVTLLHVGQQPVVNPIKLPEREGISWRRESVEGDLLPSIKNFAHQWGAQLVVMGTHGHDGVLDTFLGSHTERMIRESEIALLSVPMQPKGRAAQALGKLTGA